MSQENNIIFATGRRKTTVAQVILSAGKGRLTINGRSVDEFFGGHRRHQKQAFEPLEKFPQANKYDIRIKCRGGGITGQAGAIRLGLGRAIVRLNPDQHKEFHDLGYLSRDPRMVERKKSGQPKARKRFQFSKR